MIGLYNGGVTVESLYEDIPKKKSASIISPQNSNFLLPNVSPPQLFLNITCSVYNTYWWFPDVFTSGHVSWTPVSSGRELQVGTPFTRMNQRFASGSGNSFLIEPYGDQRNVHYSVITCLPPKWRVDRMWICNMYNFLWYPISSPCRFFVSAFKTISLALITRTTPAL